MNLAFFLVVLNLFKLLIARFFPLIGDEAYYWLWGKHLDLSYVDHPPLIAYLYRALTFFLGDSELVIRLGAITLVLLISLFVYLTAKELFGQKAAVRAVLVFNLLPLFFGGGMFLVPQTLLFLFWTLSFYLLVKIIKTQKCYLWYLLGVTAGLGLLSDYIMILFFAGVGLYLLLDPKQRFWLTKKEPYLGVIISFLIFSPVIYWNISHHFPSLFYHGERAKAFNFSNILYFVLLQMVLFTPPLFLTTVAKQIKTDLLGIFSTVVFLPFALLSPFVMIGGHWPATAYLPSIVSSDRLKKFAFRFTLIFALFVNTSTLTYYLFLYPTPKEIVPNSHLAEYLKNLPPKTTIVANNLGLAALITFYGKTKVYMPPGKHPQYDLWGKPKLHQGDNVLYFALADSQMLEKLKPLFNKVTADPHKRIFTKDADIPNKTEIFYGESFKGGILP